MQMTQERSQPNLLYITDFIFHRTHSKQYIMVPVNFKQHLKSLENLFQTVPTAIRKLTARSISG